MTTSGRQTDDILTTFLTTSAAPAANPPAAGVRHERSARAIGAGGQCSRAATRSITHGRLSRVGQRVLERLWRAALALLCRPRSESPADV